ncbi:hypothetical protein [Streptomyces bobili]|uniref:hypothetical protein n=1 Tax=Streptomyces bobili TaxID=67280 RepID=UPI000A374726|nr:hypothetical protein [Streptomyces bobili]
MVAPAHQLLPAQSKRPAVPSAYTEEPHPHVCSAEGARAETPLTSEPPLPDAEPLTSEPPLAAADSDFTRP